MKKCLGIAAVILMLAGFTYFPKDSSAGAQKPAKPKLAVIVVFDQMRGDYLEKWQDLFGEGGFKRLQSEGAWFTNCHYPYSDTLTAVGHTSLVTGTSPYKHGIIANEWYDRSSGKETTAVRSDRYELVPPPIPSKDNKKVPGASPLHRRQETIGDVLLAPPTAKPRSARFRSRNGRPS